MRRTVSITMLWYAAAACALAASPGCASKENPPATRANTPPTGSSTPAATSGAGSGAPSAPGLGSQDIDNVAPPPPAAGTPAAMSGSAGSAPNPVRGLRAEDLLRGSCKTSTVESKLLPANILFVLDRSASMLCNPPPTTQSALCEKEPTRDRANLPSKWEITTQALLQAIRGLPASATIGLSYFSNDNECGVNSSPSVPLVLNSASQQDAIERSIGSVSPGGGTPLVGATILAYAHMHATALAGKITGNEFVVLITDGAQSEQCSYEPRCSDAASCTEILVGQEVPKAAGPGVGIHTFVIGVPGSEPARTVLSQIAKLGATAPDGCDPQQGNCHFDMTAVPDLSAALNGALAKIAGEAVSCELNVPKPDKGALDPSLVNVVYTPSGGKEAVVISKDQRTGCEAGANGWQYADMNQKIRLCGDTCNSVRSDPAARVDVVLGCPSVLQ